jgi:glycolate oxidase FAD binding subunit
MIAAPPKTLPLSETYTPATQADLAETVRAAYAARTPIYPLGGGTALSYGLAARMPGWGLSTAALNKVVDYPARDLTITVEAGITIAELQKALAAEGQHLPVDVAQPDVATLGGAIAVNMSGPRRCGHGTLRDYVIGISAVDGRGEEFHAGGRVVKNVAGYDFCKLLVGSLGTLAVVTQVTLKVKPVPVSTAWVAVDATNLEQAEITMAAVAASRTTPIAVEFLAGPGWSEAAVDIGGELSESAGRVLIGLEGTAAETEWMTSKLHEELAVSGVQTVRTIASGKQVSLSDRLATFGCGKTDASSPLVLKCNVRPSRLMELVAEVRRLFPSADLLAHAANGILLVRFGGTTSIHDIAKPLISSLQPLAAKCGGQCVVWNSPAPEDLTRAVCWGPARESDVALRRVKQTFDPHGILNPGRFIY